MVDFFLLSDAGRDGVRLHQEEGVGDTGVDDILHICNVDSEPKMSSTDNTIFIVHCIVGFFPPFIALLCIQDRRCIETGN